MDGGSGPDGGFGPVMMVGPGAWDAAAERAVIAAVMLDESRSGVFEQASAILTAQDFYDPRHAVVWEVLAALHARGEPVDVLTIVAELRLRERLNTVGGAQFIGELTDEIPTLAHVASHAAIVADLSERRRAQQAYQLAARRVGAGESVARVSMEVAESLAASRRKVHDVGLVAGDLAAVGEQFWRRRERRECPLPMPWRNAASLLGGGLWPGMYVLVGGTGAGKTQWAVQVAVEAARAHHRALYLALELSRTDICARVIGAVADVPWSGILRGELDDEELARMGAVGPTLEALPIFTECGAPYGYGVEALSARAAALKPALIVLDYLQLCAGRPGEDARTTVGRVSYVARSLARDGAVVLVLSSTARANYGDLVNDPNRDPSDLVGLGKESGEIEYAADGVFVMSRDKEDPRRRTMIVAKNRHGGLGRCDFDWSGTAYREAEVM